MDRLLNKEVWLVGKGPSLDTYDWSKAGPFRIGINETAFLIPKCWGAIAIDFRILQKYADRIAEEKAKLDEGVVVEHPFKDVVIFRKSTHVDYNFPMMYLWVRGIEADDLCATAPVAIQVLHYLGVKKIHFVGFDSIDSHNSDYADCVHAIQAEGETRDSYSTINYHILSLIEQLGVTAIWEHRLT